MKSNVKVKKKKKKKKDAQAFEGATCKQGYPAFSLLRQPPSSGCNLED